MAVLIRVGNSEGERLCDERCYNATTSHCDCCCNGMNHGKGRQQAEANTAKAGREMLQRWIGKHPEFKESVFSIVTQLGFFDSVSFDDRGDPIDTK